MVEKANATTSYTAALAGASLSEGKGARWATLAKDGSYQFKAVSFRASESQTKYVSILWQDVMQDEDAAGEVVYDSVIISGQIERLDRNAEGGKRMVDNVENLGLLLDAFGETEFKLALAQRNVPVTLELAQEVCTRLEGKIAHGYFARRKARDSADIRSERRAFILPKSYEQAKKTGVNFRKASLLRTEAEGGSITSAPTGAVTNTQVNEEMADLV
jgi:hypothetical protein